MKPTSQQIRDMLMRARAERSEANMKFNARIAILEDDLVRALQREGKLG